MSMNEINVYNHDTLDCIKYQRVAFILCHVTLTKWAYPCTLEIPSIWQTYPTFLRLNAVTGWCGQLEAFTYVSVDLGSIHRVKAILVKGVITQDVVGRPTEIRFFYKEQESDNYVVYFPNFNLTARDPGMTMLLNKDAL